MSWSRRMTGTASSVIAEAERWVDELANAEHLEADARVRKAESAQAERVLEVVKVFADQSQPGFVITVSAGGAVSDEAVHARSYYCNLGGYLPAVVTANPRG